MTGVMLILSRLLVVGHPLLFAVTAFSALQALPIRGAPLAVMLVVNAIVVAIGVAAGRALTSRARHAFPFTHAALALSAAMDVVRYSTSVFPNNRLPGTTPYYVAASLAYHAAWMLYLSRRPSGPING